MQAAPPTVEAHHRVLVVDDDVRSRDAVAQILGEEGYDAAVASDGEEACSLLASWRPDLVVTDLNMPRLDGRGLLQRVHTVFPGIPVIILSARGVAEAGRLTEGMGAAGFFAKPVRVEDLLARIRALIGS